MSAQCHSPALEVHCTGIEKEIKIPILNCSDSERQQLRTENLFLKQRSNALAQEIEQWKEKYKIIEESNASIVAIHERTLNGMQNRLELEDIVASLEVEKSTRHALEEELRIQKYKSLSAEKKLRNVTSELETCRRNELIFAQSIAQFEQQSQSQIQSQNETAHYKNLLGTLESTFEREKKQFSMDLETKQGQVKNFQGKYEKIQAELHQLQEHHDLLQQQYQELEAQIQTYQAQNQLLSTEAAVARSKYEQLEKMDASLRLQLKQQSQETEHAIRENTVLKQENRELKMIADDLMILAEKQEAEKEKQRQILLAAQKSLTVEGEGALKPRVRHSLA